MTYRSAAALVTASGLGGLLTAWLLAPDYFHSRGFPLDEAWIHAVYGRSLAQSGLLAYNPGIPATGATSPLWAVALAALHLVASSVPTLLLSAKLLGFSLHLLGTLLLLRGLDERDGVGAPSLLGCALAAYHPDLVAASLSGMEIPLAALVAAGLLLAARGSGPLGYGTLSLAAPLARPELSVLCFALPVALWIQRDRRRLGRLVGAAAVGNAAALGLVGGYTLAVSGLPRLASYPAKVGAEAASLVSGGVAGFRELLGAFPVADSSILVGAAAVVAVRVVLSRPVAGAALYSPAAALLGALTLCVACFVLVPPADPRAFHQQRYTLPVLPLMVGAVPVLVLAELRRLLPARPARLARVGVVALLLLSVLVTARVRYTALANNAQNIDDVQVSIGKRLASAAPGDVAWVVDGGAIRYFGNAFVVDLTGLNNAQMLGAGAQRFLDRHPPRYIELVPMSSVMDAEAGRGLTAAHFRPTTPYTVSGYPALQHHWLVGCDEASHPRRIDVRGRLFAFRCAPRAPTAGTSGL